MSNEDEHSEPDKRASISDGPFLGVQWNEKVCAWHWSSAKRCNMPADTPSTPPPHPQSNPASRKPAKHLSTVFGARPGQAAREKRIRPSRDPAEKTKFGKGRNAYATRTGRQVVQGAGEVPLM